MRKRAIVLHPSDNVATALADFDEGDSVDAMGSTVTVREKVPFGHKVALCRIACGAPITKYGEQIGLATLDVPEGACVHTHNVDSQRGRGDRAAEGERRATRFWDTGAPTTPSAFAITLRSLP